MESEARPAGATANILCPEFCSLTACNQDTGFVDCVLQCMPYLHTIQGFQIFAVKRSENPAVFDPQTAALTNKSIVGLQGDVPQ